MGDSESAIPSVESAYEASAEERFAIVPGAYCADCAAEEAADCTSETALIAESNCGSMAASAFCRKRSERAQAASERRRPAAASTAARAANAASVFFSMSAICILSTNPYKSRRWHAPGRQSASYPPM